MKSSQLLRKSSGSILSQARLRKGFAAMFAAALALGLGAGSVIAQGPYYPEVNPNGGAPFNPNGVPIVSSAELNLIETYMPAGKTLVLPPPTGKTTASSADYQAAVQAAAAAVGAAGGTLGSVTISSLGAQVALYRAAGTSQVSAALTGFSAGIVASSVNKQADLENLAFSVAQANPGQLNAANFLPIFHAAAGSDALVGYVGAILNQVIAGAKAGSPPAAQLLPSGVTNVVTNAVGELFNSSAPSAATPAARGTLIYNLATLVVPSVAGSSANLDAAAAALTAAGYQAPGVVTLQNMVLTIRNAAGGGAITDVSAGAIAQGALRNSGNVNGAGYVAIKAGLPGNAYATNLVDSYSNFSSAANATVRATTDPDPVAVAAAGALKFPASAPQITKDVLNAVPLSAGDVQKVVGRAVGAIQSAAAAIAGAAVTAVGPNVNAGNVTYGAVFSAQVGSAGAVARQVLSTATFAGTNIQQVANNSIQAAADASPSSPQDAYADIANNLGGLLRTGTAANNQTAIDTLVQKIAALGGPTYIAVVGQMAGSLKSFNAQILSQAQTTATTFAPGDLPAINIGASLVNTLGAVPLTNYQAILTSTASATTDAQRLSVLYAAVLANSGDAAGGLAVLINGSPNALAPALTAAAVSANRVNQTAMTVASAVAVHTKANTNDIQAYIGQQLLSNPSAAKEITSAATVVAPQFSHVIAHALAFNQPTTVYGNVDNIFLHAKITLLNGAVNFVNDRPAAVAAITAGLTTGILENTLNNTLNPADTKTALKAMIARVVANAVNTPYNDVRSIGGGANQVLLGSNKGLDFRRTNGTAAGFTNTGVPGVAGSITGFVAQMVKLGDLTIDADGSGQVAAAITQAAFSAAALTGNAYILDIAQAAGQAYGWVSGQTSSAAAVLAIRTAILAGNASYTAAQLDFAAAFGISEANGGAGRQGAGAEGLRDKAGNPLAPYYDHHSASGTPVSNIFNL